MMSDDISETNRQKPATSQQGTSTDNDNDHISSTTPPTTRCTTNLVATTSLSTTTFKYTTNELLYSSRTTQGRPTANVCTWLRSYIQFFCSCDLDLEHMTLIHENDLDILKMYWQTKDEPSRSMLSKVTAESNRRTNHDRHTGQMRLNTFTTATFAGNNNNNNNNNRAVATRCWQIEMFLSGSSLTPSHVVSNKCTDKQLAVERCSPACIVCDINKHWPNNSY